MSGTPHRIRKQSSSRIGSVLIVDEPTSPRWCSDAEVGFRLADPYRPGGIYAQPARAARKAGGGSGPVPLTKSVSAPAGLTGYGGEWPGEGAPDDDEDVFARFVDPPQPTCDVMVADTWRCRGCGTTDPELLVENRDSALVCEACGVVCGQVPVALCRQKACPREEDKTQVADDRAYDPDAAAIEALVGGEPETAYERRRRLVKSAGGGRVRRSTSKKLDLAAAQARVDTESIRGVRERIEGSGKLAKKRRAVLRVIEAIYDQLGPTLDQRVAKHIRQEAVRILNNGMAHAEACCGEEHCQIALGSRSNALLAICTVQACLEDLTLASSNDRHNPRGPTLAEVAPGCSAQELSKHLERSRELRMQGSVGAQRAQVAAAVGIVKGWTSAQICRPCCAPMAPRPASAPPLPLVLPGGSDASPPASPSLPTFAMPPQLCLLGATPRTDDRGTAVSSTAKDAQLEQQQQQDVIWSVRDLIHGASVLANARASVRCTAHAAIMKPGLAEWIRTKNVLPIDVLSVVILRAAASKLRVEDTASQLLDHYCFQNNISPTTARDVAETVAGMIVVDPATPAGLFADGIF